MEVIRSHRDLLVWQKSINLAKAVYGLAKSLPKTEQYGISSQMLRAVVSVAANLAEGHGRNTRKDYARFVSIARGSVAELDTLLHLAVECELLSAESVAPVDILNNEIGRMLNSLWRKLDSAADAQPNP